MTSTTPRKMMTKSRMPAMTPAIFTVWSVCFSGSTASGFRVAAPGTGSPDNHCWNESLRSDDNTTNRHHVTHRHSAAGRERHKIYMMMCFLLVKQVSVSGHWITSESFMKIQMWAVTPAFELYKRLKQLYLDERSEVRAVVCLQCNVMHVEPNINFQR